MIGGLAGMMSFLSRTPLDSSETALIAYTAASLYGREVKCMQSVVGLNP